MNATDDRAKSIFLNAAEIAVAEERRAYVEAQCEGNESLRNEVEELLRHQQSLGSFLEGSSASLDATVLHEPQISERPGTVIGPYKLLQQIGEGGMGVVFMAEQTQPLQRTVALKIIKPGMDTRQIIARFEAERQALAMMDHPNIARVLDAGATASGRPYFVMELVKGVPITEFCDKNHMPSEARLALFIDVAHAIQHAHHKGIIHRDVKPSNVMVTLHDGVPVVKVIDFGVAKATVQKLTEKTLFTAFGQMVGTPSYMSPEQAEMSGLDIDTRSDIFSLGVLLYELLTGTTPLDVERLREAGFVEMQRLIREEQAPRPSTRLSSLGDSATILAGNRGTDVKQLARLLTGDLDWIVMKALEKDRNRRYVTPGNFAEDVERYLKREAILARPPSTAYRLKKFAQRNRVAVLTAATVGVALVAGTAIATWQAVVATQAKQQTLASMAAEKEAKHNALAREAETRAVLEFVQDKVFAAARPEGQEGGLGREVTLRDAVEGALPFVEKSFTNQPTIEARLRITLGDSFLYLGEARIAAEQYEAARALYAQHLGPDHPDTLVSMSSLVAVYNELGRPADALKLGEETLALMKAKLGPDNPDTLRTMVKLANSYAGLGQRADALQLREETLTLMKAKLGPDHPDTLRSMDNLAHSYSDFGRYADALKLREETLTLMKAKLGSEHPETLKSMSNLASSYEALGQQDDALKLREATLALIKAKLGPEHPATLRGMNDLASSYRPLQRHADALKLRKETLSFCQATLGHDHPYTLTAMYNLHVSYSDLGRNVDAFKLMKKTLALSQTKLGPDHPDTLLYMTGLAFSYLRVGLLDDACKLLEKTLPIQSAKLGPDHRVTLSSMDLLAHSYAQLDRKADALKLREELLSLRQAKLGPNHPDTLFSLTTLATLYGDMGKPEEAIALLQNASDENPSNPETLKLLAANCARRGKWKLAAPSFARAYELNPADHLLLLNAVAAALEAGDRDGYRRLCSQALEQFAATDDPVAADRAAKAGLLVARPADELKQFVHLAEVAVEKGAEHDWRHYFQLARGMAAYRTGDWAGTLDWCGRSREQSGNIAAMAAADFLFEAMAHHRLNHADQAHAAMDRATKLIDEYLAEAHEDRGDQWGDWLISEIVRREAEELLKEESAIGDQQPGKTEKPE